jgi:uncharacterized protein YegL
VSVKLVPQPAVSQPVVSVNAQQQILLALALDCSTSMTTPCPCERSDSRPGLTSPLAELRAALPLFKSQCAGDALLKLGLSVATVLFNETVTPAPFRAIAEWEPPTIESGQGTALGLAVNTAIDLVVARLQELKDLGVPVRHTFVLTITDGAECSSRPEMVGVSAGRVGDLERAGEFTFLPVGIQDADLARLAVFTSKRPPAKLKGLNFASLFNWLFRSVGVMSRSQVGDRVNFDNPVLSPSNPKGWMDPNS